METQVNVYNPQDITTTVGSRRVKGFAEDTMVEVIRDKSAVDTIQGITGEAIHVPIKSRSGLIRMHIKQTAEINTYFKRRLAIQENNPDPSALVDVSAGDTIATNCLIKTLPDESWGRKAGAIVWEFLSTNIKSRV